MTKRTLFISIAYLLFFTGVIILTTDTYFKAKDLVETQIANAERTYAQGKFDSLRIKYPKDEHNEALYWYIQTLK